MDRMKRLVFLPLLTLASCASVSTFVGQSSDLAADGPQVREQQALMQQRDTSAENASLRYQLGSLQQQGAGLQTQLAGARHALNQVNARLAQSRTATQEQRDAYNRLAAQQRALQRGLDAARAHPTPTNAADAARQKAELDRLTAQQNVLQQQVDALSRAL